MASAMSQYLPPPNPPDRTHSPSQTWSYRVPSPPRIVVPPPPLANNGIPDLQVVSSSKLSDFESSGFTNTDFLAKVTYNNFLKSNAMLEWKYEERRKSQQILPFLYLGPSSAAKDKAFLEREGITMVFAVRNTLSAQARLLGSKVAQELGIHTEAVDVAGNQELIAAFPRGIELINQHLSQIYKMQERTAASDRMGKVLVFCESGNERSASMVVAYIMAMYSKDLVTAVQIVQAQRFAVAFDDGMRNLLRTYESILKAKRDVMRLGLGGVNGGGGGSKGKRALVHDEEDADMVDVGRVEPSDMERFMGRKTRAPFLD